MTRTPLKKMELHNVIREALQIPNLVITDIEPNGGGKGIPRLRGSIGTDRVNLDRGPDGWTVEAPDTKVNQASSLRLIDALGLLALGFQAEYQRALSRFQHFQSLIDVEMPPFTEEEYGGKMVEEAPAPVDYKQTLDGITKYRAKAFRRLTISEAIPTLAVFLGAETFSPAEATRWLTQINYRLRSGRVIRGRDNNVFSAFRRSLDEGILEKVSNGVYRVSDPGRWASRTNN